MGSDGLDGDIRSADAGEEWLWRLDCDSDCGGGEDERELRGGPRAVLIALETDRTRSYRTDRK